MLYNEIFNKCPKSSENYVPAKRKILSEETMAFGRKLSEEAARKAGNMNFHVSDGTPEPVYINGYRVATGAQVEAAINIKNRDNANDTLNNILKENNIQLSSDEKMTLTVDRDLKISVTGLEDKEKMAKIEKALNNANAPYGIKYARALLGGIKAVRNFNGIENPFEVKKFIVYDYVKNETGQDINDFKLVDGEIVGANDKLKAIFRNPPGYGDNPSEESPKCLERDLKKLLAYGMDNITDMNRSIDFQNGHLIDKDVQYGFGPEQLKSWFDNLMGGSRSRINTTI